MKKRKINIAVISVSRSDYSILKPVLKKIEKSEDANLHLIISGMHLVKEFGYTINDILKEGWKVFAKIEHLISSDTPAAVSKSIGLGIISFSDLFQRYSPDFLVILGDRFEMISVAIAAQPFGIPIAHIQGGEITRGAIDDVFRHSITKMSNLHFVTTNMHKKRVIQMGEQPNTVFLSGSPALDNLIGLKFKKKNFLPFHLKEKFLICTYHPETRNYKNVKSSFEKILLALKKFKGHIIFTAPNADTGGLIITSLIEKEVSINKKWHYYKNLGVENYYYVLNYAYAMIGNSSSGIIEAASFNLPVINIGNRQEGRDRSKNVCDVPCQTSKIEKAINELEGFSKYCKEGIDNKYWAGGAAEIICNQIIKQAKKKSLITKNFFDINNEN